MTLQLLMRSIAKRKSSITHNSNPFSATKTPLAGQQTNLLSQLQARGVDVIVSFMPIIAAVPCVAHTGRAALHCCLH